MNIEKIESNWKTFEKLCKKLSDPNIDKMIDELGERIVMCPASPKKDQPGCFPGGLVQHSLDVALTMRSLNDTLGYNLSTAALLKVGLLHDLGKIGSREKSYFIDQDSDWHRDKLGQLYKFNDDLNKMSVSHRTLCLLQSFGAELTTDEWIAIQLSQGSHFEENRFYVGHEPTLALVLQQSKASTIHKNRLT